MVDAPLRSGIRWLAATSGGLLVTLLFGAALAERVRSAEASVLAAVPLAPEPRCADGFVASGVQLLPVSAVVGHRERASRPLAPIAGASLVELEGATDLDWHTVETPVTTSDAEGRLAFSWTRRFRDRYACGALVDSWQQASQLFVVRAPGCAEETLIVTPDWRHQEIVLACPGRRAPVGRITL
jgi:hypothetical protein